jgi:hypothetical protein
LDHLSNMFCIACVAAEKKPHTCHRLPYLNYVFVDLIVVI